MDRHEERAHAAARQATAAQTSNRPLTSYSQIEQSQPCQLCGQRIVLRIAIGQGSRRSIWLPWPVNPKTTPAACEYAGERRGRAAWLDDICDK
jgi:hypothetical protein